MMARTIRAWGAIEVEQPGYWKPSPGKTPAPVSLRGANFRWNLISDRLASCWSRIAGKSLHLDAWITCAHRGEILAIRLGR